MQDELKTLRHQESTRHLEPIKNDEDLQNQLLEEQTRNEVYLQKINELVEQINYLTDELEAAKK